MADFGTALTVAQTLFAALDCSLVKEAYAVSKYESELERLKTTVATVQSVLVDAGKKVKLSQTDLNYIHKLKDAVYDADDLFDKFITIAARKQNGSFCDKVRDFFSSENPIKVAHEIFRDVKKIRSHLDAIADDRTKFGFSVDTQPLRRRREETCSYLYANNVIGRDGDAAEIMHRLLDSAEDIGFLTIVGIGGLGKTTLAKLVFSDKRIESNFPVRLWVCVADQEGAPFDPKVILSKMLELVGCQVASNATIEKVQTEYQSKIGGKKLFLVLDDIWTEKKLEWLRFKEFLMSSGPGSRIIVTTRSMETARIIGNGVSTNTYVLQGLSDKDSWCLFEMSAFEKGSKHPMFVEIGKKIVQKCHNLPLAINVIGSLLYGLPCDKWQAFETNGFDGVFSGDNEVMSILRFSYDQLEPSLKSCFTYCAIFPKGFVIDKEMLLNIWEAQGYLVPFDNCHSIENVGEEHFSVLLKRCFFQDINKNEYGEVESFKIHDFMHDLAQNVSESECFSKNSRMAGLKSSARHIFETVSGFDEITNYKIKSTARSYFQSYPRYVNIMTSISMGKMIENWVCLRVLSSKLCMSSLPNSMGNLIHLRYLNLSDSLIEKLPNSIVKLHNLLTLNLNNCKELKKLPKKFSKLVNLSHLYLDGSGLKYMPVGISKLSGLRVLTKFVIKDESVSGRQHVGQLNDLKAIAMNLKGRIHILFSEQLTSAEGYDWEESCLKRAEHLKELHIDFSDEEMEWVTQETVMKMLWPHPELKKFVLNFYRGETIKCRGSAQDNWATILPNLVAIELHMCSRLQQLPLLSDLQHLKHLTLDSLSTLEYMEEASSRSSESKHTFFPSLENLKITNCTKLKGWWRHDNASTHSQLAFPHLSGLVIGGCNELTSLPPCPWLHTLKLLRNNRALRITTTNEGQSSSSTILSCCDEKPGSNHDSGNANCSIFEVDLIPHLKPVAYQFLAKLHISNDEIESLSEAEEMFQSCFFLEKLKIKECSKLTSLCGGLEHLTALHSLTLSQCLELKLEEGDRDDCSAMPWRALHSNLRSLELNNLPKVEKLPMGMKYLTSLQRLEITSCKNLKEIPEWVGCLQSLQSLDIWGCPAITSLPDAMLKLTSLQTLGIWHCRGLRERCREPNGQDWPKIKHIPQMKINDI